MCWVRQTYYNHSLYEKQGEDLCSPSLLSCEPPTLPHMNETLYRVESFIDWRAFWNETLYRTKRFVEWNSIE